MLKVRSVIHKENRSEVVENKNTIFHLRDLNLWYGKNHALKRITCDFYERDVTAIIGPSGCGKSTLVKIFNRMTDLIPSVKTAGDIWYKGENILDVGYDVETLRTEIGMVFQKPNPFPMSIYDNVAYGPKIHGVRNRAELDRIVEKSLRQAALWDEVKDRLKEHAHRLSGGQQQRLCIARCLAIEPSVILMDEPTSALDPIATAKVEELVQNLQQQYSIVIVTHNMQQAARISDRAAFMLNGELIEMDETSRIFSMPQKKQTEDYITGRFG